MSSTMLTSSPVWTAAGWTMLHTDVGRRGHRTLGCHCTPALEGGAARNRGMLLRWVLAGAVGSPVLIFIGIFEPASTTNVGQCALNQVRWRARFHSRARSVFQHQARAASTWHLMGESIARRGRRSSRS